MFQKYTSFIILVWITIFSYPSLSGQKCNLVKLLAEDLPSTELESFLSKPENVKVYEILAGNGEGSLSTIRKNLDNLKVLQNLSSRFNFEGSEGIEGLAKLFEKYPATEYEYLVATLKKLDQEFDNGDALKIIITLDENQRINVRFGNSGADSRDLVPRNPPPPRKPTTLEEIKVKIEEFDNKLGELTSEFVDNSKPATTTTFGDDDAVTCGKLYPTPNGAMDIHIHGTFSEGKYTFGKKVRIANTDKFITIEYTMEQMANKIMQHENFKSTNVVRLFSCHGAYAGAEMALLLNKPVITGSTDVINVFPNNGDQYLPTGTLLLFRN